MNEENPVTVVIAPEQPPVPVVLAAPEGTGAPLTAQEVLQSPVFVTSGKGTVAAPTTTEHENVVTAGEMRNAQIMEYSQAIIALTVTGAIIFTSVTGIHAEDLANAFFVIIGFYFANAVTRKVNGFGKTRTG